MNRSYCLTSNSGLVCPDCRFSRPRDRRRQRLEYPRSPRHHDDLTVTLGPTDRDSHSLSLGHLSSICDGIRTVSRRELVPDETDPK